MWRIFIIDFEIISATAADVPPPPSLDKSACTDIVWLLNFIYYGHFRNSEPFFKFPDDQLPNPWLYCKALSQSKIEGLALVPIPPTTHPPTTRRKSKDISLCKALSQSQIILGLLRWKTTLIFQKWKMSSIFFKWKTT